MKAETFSTADGCTSLLRYRGAAGVEVKQLANFKAAITRTFYDDDGEPVYLVRGVAQDGDCFSFQIPARKFNSHYHFSRALYNGSGAGTVVYPGCWAALRRAIMDASISSKVEEVISS